MQTIRHQAPHEQLGLTLPEGFGKPFKKRFPIAAVFKDIPALDAAGHHVLEEASKIDSRCSGHAGIIFPTRYGCQ
jgi:hypothetical protein